MISRGPAGIFTSFSALHDTGRHRYALQNKLLETPSRMLSPQAGSWHEQVCEQPTSTASLKWGGAEGCREHLIGYCPVPQSCRTASAVLGVSRV